MIINGFKPDQCYFQNVASRRLHLLCWGKIGMECSVFTNSQSHNLGLGALKPARAGPLFFHAVPAQFLKANRKVLHGTVKGPARIPCGSQGVIGSEEFINSENPICDNNFSYNV